MKENVYCYTLIPITRFVFISIQWNIKYWNRSTPSQANVKSTPSGWMIDTINEFNMHRECVFKKKKIESPCIERGKKMLIINNRKFFSVAFFFLFMVTMEPTLVINLIIFERIHFITITKRKVIRISYMPWNNLFKVHSFAMNAIKRIAILKVALYIQTWCCFMHFLSYLLKFNDSKHSCTWWLSGIDEFSIIIMLMVELNKFFGKDFCSILNFHNWNWIETNSWSRGDFILFHFVSVIADSLMNGWNEFDSLLIIYT